jgi:hypothetical protein
MEPPQRPQPEQAADRYSGPSAPNLIDHLSEDLIEQTQTRFGLQDISTHPTSNGEAAIQSDEVASRIVDQQALHSCNFRRISRFEWDSYKATIQRQYPRMTLPQLKKLMTEEHGFVAR